MSDKSSRALREFLGEAEEIIDNLNADIIELDRSVATGEAHPDLLNSIFRSAHTLKGISGMFGFQDIAALAHQMESLLDGLRLGKLAPGAAVVELLLESVELLGSLMAGKNQSVDFTLDVSGLEQRLALALKGESGGAGADLLAELDLGAGLLDVLTEYEEHRLRENLKKNRNFYRVLAAFDLATFDTDLSKLNEILKQEGEVISTLPSPEGSDADKIAFQILLGSSLSFDEIAAKVTGSGAALKAVARRGATAGAAAALPSVAAEVPATVEDSAAETASLRSLSRMVRVDIDKLDHLMNIVGELVIAKGAISELSERLRREGGEVAADLAKANRVLERRLAELQKGVMEVRMVPVSQLFDRMARVVRKLAADLGKQVSLEIRGGDTELDKLIIEDLADPLMHIIRNAIDHGIEPPQLRQQAGKPMSGKVGLSAMQKGNHVVIEVSDDGRGLDPEKIRAKAVERGLINAHTEMSRGEIFELIFLPGFSTAENVSEVSGRGVGMDVVKSNISALSGMIELDSEPGRGTRLVITLPITLAIIKALIVRVAGKEFALPITAVMETMLAGREAIRTIEGREVLELRRATLPLVRLERLFGLGAGDATAERFFLVIAGMAEKRLGIVVDELLGQQDVVIKPLGSALSFVRGFAGAAEMGNRRTILVLDVGSLISEALKGEALAHV